MTYYYYVAADFNLHITEYFQAATIRKIPGFDYAIQVEIWNGIETIEEATNLYDYLMNVIENKKVCTIQIANLLNSNRVPLKVHQKSKILLHEIKDCKQLLLQPGHLLTIKKVPFY